MASILHCSLCGGENLVPFFHDEQRDYLRCARCKLIVTPPEFFLSGEDEKKHYDMHENDPADVGYRQFLGRLFDPLVGRLPVAGVGLDFGSGPGPTLSVMFQEAGYEMEIYDIYYAPDRAVLNGVYDFITATEVVEHLSCPGTVLNMLWSQLKPGGWLGLMTKLALDREAFARWHYKADPTHIVFFSRETFQWLGQTWNSVPEFIGSDVILYRKPLPGA